MKKKLNYLQLFAEEASTEGTEGFEGKGAEDSGTKTSESNDAEGKENAHKQQEEGEEKKYTDKDLDKIISKKFSEWAKKKDAEVDEAKKLAEMNAQQKAEYERDKLQKELDELKQKNTLSEMTKEARRMLSEEEINVSDEIITFLVTNDANKTQENVSAFSKAYKEAVEAGIKAAIKGEIPKGGSGNKGMTKDDILKVKDPLERQKLMAEHPKLFGL